MAKTVLVADDNETIRREICRVLLRETECEICGEAHHGLDAIEKAQQLHPNSIILDLSMPVMNGIDAARALRARMPTVPIIMFPLYVDPFLKEELRSAGVADVVSKSEIFPCSHKKRGPFFIKALLDGTSRLACRTSLAPTFRCVPCRNLTPQNVQSF